MASTSTRPTSAIRIAHLPTGIVVQYQDDPWQHRDRAEAMAMLKPRFYKLELRKCPAAADDLEAGKTDIGWGHHNCSRVLDNSRRGYAHQLRHLRHAEGARQ